MHLSELLSRLLHHASVDADADVLPLLVLLYLQSMRPCWCAQRRQQQHRRLHVGWMHLLWNLWCHRAQSSRHPTCCCRCGTHYHLNA